MEVGLTYNLKTDSSSNDEEPPGNFRDSEAEWDDPATIHAVRDALAQRHHVVLIEANEEAFSHFRHLRSQLDIVFNMAEGLNGGSREAQIPSMLEFLGIPYTGSDPLTLSTCLDKGRTKEILSYYNIATARFTVLSGSNGELHGNHSNPLNGLAYPLVVKPLHEGSSKGIFNDSLVEDEEGLRKAVARVLESYHQPALVEEFLVGREFTVAILGNGERVRALPIVEIKFNGLPRGANPIYSYEAKWVWDRPTNPLSVFECPANIEDGLRRQIEAICLRAYHALRCRDWCRIDIRLNGLGRPCILELNPLPGILPDPEENSCFPKAARAASMGYDELINTVLDIAGQRYGLV